MEQQGQKSNQLWTLEASSCSTLVQPPEGDKILFTCLYLIYNVQTNKQKKISMMDIIIIR